MTVSNSNSRSQFVLSVPNQTLPTDFYFLEKEDLKVISDINGTLVLDALLIGYSVNLPPEVGQEGEVVMIGGIAGEIITIINDLECNQLLDYVENDDFPAELHERGLDKLTMLICRLADDFDLRAIQYPITELTTNPIVPILSDRQAGGAGTVFGWRGTDGAPDVLSKGSLDLVLTLSNDSALGGVAPSPVNGVTQAAVKTYIDAADTSLKADIDAIITAVGLNANGTYKQPTTSNFIDTSTGVDIALLQLDAEIFINRSDITALQADLVVPASKIIIGTASSTLFRVVFTKTAAQTWQELQLYGHMDITSNGSFRVDSVTVSGSGGTAQQNYTLGESNGQGNSDDTSARDVICTVIPTDPTQNSITVDVNMTTAVQVRTPTAYGVGRLFE